MNALMLGNALDTNGQKARFVEAAKRWGDDPDVLKALWVGKNDMAGVAGRFAQASQGGPLVIRSAHRAQYAFFQYPVDIDWSRQNEGLVRELAAQADVVHLTNDVKAYFRLRLPKYRKPAVLHHHGTLFRSQSERLLSEARRLHMVSTVSTIDLMRYSPAVHWLPTAYNLDELAAIRREHRGEPDGVIRVVSAPTNREIKSTAVLEAAVHALQAEGLPVELVLIEGKTWAECLRIKATADIYFDQVGLGYGCNAVEAWGMGIPVIAGADEWTLAKMEELWGGIPFYPATEASIKDAIAHLADTPNLRDAYAGLGRKHVEKYHAEKPALIRLASLYRMAIDKMDAAAEDAPLEEYVTAPGRFRTTLRPNLKLTIGNQQVRFTDYEAKVDNPALARKLREMASSSSRHQVYEVLTETDEYHPSEGVA